MEPSAVPESRQAQIDELLKRLRLPIPPPSYQIINQALVHRSYAVEQSVEDNERLEFLGDSVINLATAEYLWETRPTDSEGDLSKLRAAMVSRKVLGVIGMELEIDGLLQLGVGEENTGGRRRQNTIGSALEALFGAFYQIYPWDTLRQSLREQVILHALELSEHRHMIDHKSTLQEWTQKHVQAVPEYTVTESSGPDHKKLFALEVSIAGEVVAKGHGARIKWAENDAARIVLEMIEQGRYPESQTLP